MATRKSLVANFFIFFILIIILIILTGCLSPGSTKSAKPVGVNLNFVVSYNANLCQVSKISLLLFDPTQGYQNPVQSILLKRDTTSASFHTSIQVPIKSNIHYRYVINDKYPEVLPSGVPVLFRYYPVSTHADILDKISGWDGCAPSQKTGTLDGMVTSSGNPVQDVWIHVAGSWSTSHSDGTFRISNLPEGIQTLSIFHPEGKYKPITSLVEIQAGKTTPVKLSTTEAKEIQLTWIVSLPEDYSTNTVVKFVSNLPGYGGMSFSDEWMGTTRAEDLPALIKHDEQTLYFSGKFYEGMELRYTYSLWDGSVGRETSGGEVFTRFMIIPAEDTIIHNEIESFTTNDYHPRSISVSIPDNTPITDLISIQFNQKGWLQPIPMSRITKNLFSFNLTSGFDYSEPIQYRFCRNNLCDLTMETLANGSSPIIYPLDLTNPADILHKINHWQFIPEAKPVLRIGLRQDVISRSDDGFLSGLEWNPCFLPVSSKELFDQGLHDLKNLGSNLLIIRPLLPTHTTNNRNYPESTFKIKTTLQYLFDDAEIQENSQIAVLPTLKWEEYQNSTAYVDWFEKYQNSILDYAKLPEIGSTDILILGGEWITPYLPPDPQNKYQSRALGNADTDWIELIHSIKASFKGKVFFALPAGIEFSAPPLFLDEVDGIYFILDPAVYAKNDIKTTLINIIDGPIKEISRIYEKPVIIGFRAPSVSPKVGLQASMSESDCLNKGKIWIEWLDKYPVDLQIQLNTYQLVLETINERDWIDGFVSQGFFPGINQYDYSSNILGKPAYELLTYWNNNLLRND